jgi:hypothetical protein
MTPNGQLASCMVVVCPSLQKGAVIGLGLPKCGEKDRSDFRPTSRSQ